MSTKPRKRAYDAWWPGMPCGICGESMNNRYKVTWDHVLPCSRGGTATQSNLWLVHYSCNRLKENMTLSEMVAEMRKALGTGTYRGRHMWETRREKMQQILAHLEANGATSE